MHDQFVCVEKSKKILLHNFFIPHNSLHLAHNLHQKLKLFPFNYYRLVNQKNDFFIINCSSQIERFTEFRKLKFSSLIITSDIDLNFYLIKNSQIKNTKNNKFDNPKCCLLILLPRLACDFTKCRLSIDWWESSKGKSRDLRRRWLYWE